MPPERSKDDAEFYQQIGGMASDISNIKETVGVIADKVDSVVTTVAVLDHQAVKNPECTQRHVVIAQSLAQMKHEIIGEMKKVPTGNFPSVGAITAGGTAAAAPSFDEIKNKLDALTEQRTEKKRKSIQFWIATILGVAAILGGAFALLSKTFAYMSAMNVAMVQQAEQQKALRIELAKPPKVIYVKVKPDAGE